VRKGKPQQRGTAAKEAVPNEVRKCFKKVRAAIRLVRKELGDDVYRETNYCLRDAGRLLSDMNGTITGNSSLGTQFLFTDGIYSSQSRSLAIPSALTSSGYAASSFDGRDCSLATGTVLAIDRRHSGRAVAVIEHGPSFLGEPRLKMANTCVTGTLSAGAG
jgi:hypothetical protein